MSEFGNLDLEEMAGEAKRLKEQGGSASFLDQFVPMPDVKPGQVGSVAVRILPPVRGGKLYQYNRTHKINNRSIHCPRPLINDKWDRSVPCPICDKYSAIWKQIDKVEKAQGKDCPAAKELKAKANVLKPVERYYYNAVVRVMMVNGKEMKNVGPRILSVGKGLHETIIAAIVGRKDDPDSKLGNITDIKAGWDFVIRKEVTAGDGYPKYDKSGFARAQSPSGTLEEVAEWEKALHDLTKLRNPRDLEYLEKELAIHLGLIPDTAESAYDDEAFEARWRKQGDDDVADIVNQSTATKIVVSTVDPVTSQTVETTVTEAPETLAIEDEEFLKQLANMDG